MQTTAEANAVTAPSANEAAEQKLKAESQLKNGASWFYWIAGLSLINTAIVMAGSTWHFIFGLGITQIVDYVAMKLPPAAHVAGVIINLVIAGGFVLIGVIGRKGSKGAFILGMTLYVLDALIFVLGSDFLSVAFHAFALYQMYRGMAAAGVLSGMRKDTALLAQSPAAIS